MPRFSWLVLTNSMPGREQEFEKWYETQHLDDVLTVEGFVSAERYRLADVQFMPPSASDLGASAPWQYLVIYEIDTDDAARTFDALRSKVSNGSIVLSETLDPVRQASFLFIPAGVRRVSLAKGGTDR